jgi:hypothetical protein
MDHLDHLCFFDLVGLTLLDPSGWNANFRYSGPNTDLLGRRWFLVLGNLVCFVGHVIVASAKNTNQIIAGLVVSGFGGANCQVRLIRQLQQPLLGPL